MNNLCQKLVQNNCIFSKIHHYAPQKTWISVYRSLLYSFILYGSLAWQFTSKTNVNRISTLQNKFLSITTFYIYTNQSNSLLKNLKLLKVPDILELEVIKFFYLFSRFDLPKSVCSQCNLVHKVHTRDIHNNSLIYSARVPILRIDGASLWSKFFNHDLTAFLKLKAFLMKQFLQTYENEL